MQKNQSSTSKNPETWSVSMGELTAFSEVANSATNRLRVNYAMKVNFITPKNSHVTTIISFKGMGSFVNAASKFHSRYVELNVGRDLLSNLGNKIKVASGLRHILLRLRKLNSPHDSVVLKIRVSDDTTVGLINSYGSTKNLRLNALANCDVSYCEVSCIANISVRVGRGTVVTMKNLKQFSGNVEFCAEEIFLHERSSIRVGPKVDRPHGCSLGQLMRSVEPSENKPDHSSTKGAFTKPCILIAVDKGAIAVEFIRILKGTLLSVECFRSPKLKNTRRDTHRIQELTRSTMMIKDLMSTSDVVISINDPLISLLLMDPARFAATRYPRVLLKYFRCAGVVSSCIPDAVIMRKSPTTDKLTAQLDPNKSIVQCYSEDVDMRECVSGCMSVLLVQTSKVARAKIRSVIRGVLPYSAVSLITDYFDVWLTTLSSLDD